MVQKTRRWRGWNVPDQLLSYGSWTQRSHRDSALTASSPGQRPRAGARPVLWEHVGFRRGNGKFALPLRNSASGLGGQAS